MTYYGHSGNKNEQWQTLKEHLQGVAQRVEANLGDWSGRQEGLFAGLCHDAGKYTASFQSRLRGEGSGLDHWSQGASLALKHSLLASAFAIYGHHVGLPSKDILRCLSDLRRFEENHPLNLKLTTSNLDEILQRMQEDGLDLPPSPQPLITGQQGPLESMLQVRRLFSALTDADFLDTEEHMQAEARTPGLSLDVEPLLRRLNLHLESLRLNSKSSVHLQQARDIVLQEARDAAQLDPGLFSLAAPTGAGKTLAMLAFALEHCKKWGKRRIISVLPFLSLIEQTADVYRSVLQPAPGELIEHHSTVSDHYDSGSLYDARRLRLLTENWDAPLILTTSVQFLESLFAHKPSICRKLHRIAGSVILMDEIQTIPINLARYTLGALSILAQNWGCSIVMATATQPAFEHLSPQVEALKAPAWNPRPIVKEQKKLFQVLRRNRYEFLSPNQPISDNELVDRLENEAQALVVVNLKRQAVALYQALKNRGRQVLHLSTRNCPAHRTRILAEAKRRLREGKEVVLVSTQCIEAGVDVDFPRLFRAYAPLDSVVQAAGRCNREGIQADGFVTVYEPEDNLLPGQVYRQATQRHKAKVGQWLAEDPNFHDLSDPTRVQDYFRSLYDIAKTSKEDLDTALKSYDFPAVREHYRLIEQDTINIVVPYADERELFDQLKGEAENQGIHRRWIRQARSITVSEFRPKSTAPIQAFLEPLQFRIRGKTTTAVPDWFIYLEDSHYHSHLGLVPPLEMPEFVI